MCLLNRHALVGFGLSDVVVLSRAQAPQKIPDRDAITPSELKEMRIWGCKYWCQMGERGRLASVPTFDRLARSSGEESKKDVRRP